MNSEWRKLLTDRGFLGCSTLVILAAIATTTDLGQRLIAKVGDMEFQRQETKIIFKSEGRHQFQETSANQSIASAQMRPTIWPGTMVLEMVADKAFTGSLATPTPMRRFDAHRNSAPQKTKGRSELTMTETVVRRATDHQQASAMPMAPRKYTPPMGLLGCNSSRVGIGGACFDRGLDAPIAESRLVPDLAIDAEIRRRMEDGH